MRPMKLMNDMSGMKNFLPGILSLIMALAVYQASPAQGSDLVKTVENQARIIKIAAKRYEYTPREIVIKKGQPVVLQLTTEDRSHGFNIPALNLRADIKRDQVTELKFTPQTTGDLNFYCDIFCGTGHDDMAGKFKVVE